MRQRVLDQKRKKEDHRKRTKTRGKLITDSGAYGNVEVIIHSVFDEKIELFTS